MKEDKYSALWVSYSSLTDFQNCPRAYFLKHVYKDPESGQKIKIINPPLALGKIVHEVLESLSNMKVEDRFKKSLIYKFDSLWEKVSGKKGGFLNEKTEERFKKRGKEMLTKITRNPGPLANLAVKIKTNSSMKIASYWLSKEDEIILCGKIDWIEYLKETDRVHIIDFKTNKKRKNKDSLQLPIYLLLAENCQKRKVEKISYWYLEQNDKPTEMPLPDKNKAEEKILKIAKEVKLSRQLERFKCPYKTGCMYCRPYEAILNGEGELVGKGRFNEDIYILKEPLQDGEYESEIL